MDILGTHYSQKLAELAARVEETIGNKALFVPKLTPGDNSGHFVKDGAYEITLKPGSSEDDVADELVHPLLSTAGYTMIFFIPGNRFSQTIHPFIVSDFDHLFINRRLHEEGYYPEKGFMVGIELVAEKKSRKPFDPKRRIGAEVCQRIRRHWTSPVRQPCPTRSRRVRRSRSSRRPRLRPQRLRPPHDRG